MPYYLLYYPTRAPYSLTRMNNQNNQNGFESPQRDPRPVIIPGAPCRKPSSQPVDNENDENDINAVTNSINAPTALSLFGKTARCLFPEEPEATK